MRSRPPRPGGHPRHAGARRGHDRQRQQRWGKIYTPLRAWYHATKHDLEGWSDRLRYELAPHGVDVVAVEPGIIRTEWGGITEEVLLERSGAGPYVGFGGDRAFDRVVRAMV